MPALLKDKTCHPFTYAWDETELWANRDQQNRGAETAVVVIPFFLGVFAHIHGQSLCHPGLHLTETQPCASHPRGYFVCSIRSSLGVVGSGLSEQWVQSAQSQRALLGVGASTSSCACEGCGKDRNWRCVLFVLSSRRILQLFWPGKMCGERTFSCGSLGALFP